MAIEQLKSKYRSEKELTELVAGQIPNGLRIEYKKDLYWNSYGGKREFLKEAFSLANAFGGVTRLSAFHPDAIATDTPHI